MPDVRSTDRLIFLRALTMDLTIIYLIVIAGIFSSFLLRRLIPVLLSIYRNHASVYVLRHLVYPYLYRRYSFVTPITRFRALLLSLYLGATLFCNLYGIRTLEDASSRAGWLSIVNMVPLFITGRVTTIMQVLGLSLHESIAAHSATGAMVLSQSVAHISMELKRTSLDLAEKSSVFGLIVSNVSCA